MAAEVSYEIVEEIGILSTAASGWQKELNLISWNEGEPKEPLINSSARLAASFMRSAARENLDLAPLNLRFSRLHLTKKLLTIRPTHLIRASLNMIFANGDQISNAWEKASA